MGEKLLGAKVGDAVGEAVGKEVELVDTTINSIGAAVWERIGQ